MKISFTFRNFEASDHLRKYAEDRFAKLSRYFPQGTDLELEAGFELEKFRHRAEVVLTGDSLHLSAGEESGDMYSAVDLVLDKLESRVRRVRGRETDKRRRESGTVRWEALNFPASAGEEGDRRKPIIVDSNSYEPKPMMVEEAAMQLETLKYEFLVFFNAEAERINVIYRRKNGDFGLVDPGM
ncbi:MAG TPA: ribosome-associated translation inhibitor RaiA [Desulfomicrobiaceae bacterium]|nr:ribosome-associated translation inhibitor RaiA [Desulfomicrobiaceae bacterium]